MDRIKHNPDNPAIIEETCPRCNGSGEEPTDTEKGIFKKPSREQMRKVAEVIREPKEGKG